MTLMLRLQIAAVALAAANGLLVDVLFAPTTPPGRLLVFRVIYGGFLAWWAGSIAWKRWRGHADDTPDGWYAHNLAVFWLGNLATVATVWLVMPYGDVELRLMLTMFTLTPVVIEVIGTVRTPSYGLRGRLGTLAPLGIPLGLSVWHLMYDARFGVAVVVFMAGFVGILLLLREFLQNAVDRAYTAQREAEASRDARVRFLAAASHDLQQPLQAARLSFDQAERASTGPARTRARERVDWAFDAMEHQLRQILDHLRLEAGQVAAKVEPVPVGPCIARLAELNEPAARLAGASLVALPAGLAVQGDPALIARVLGNFVANALRHAAAKRVLIGARRAGPNVRLWVIDDGRGIPEADRAALFEEYAQGGWRGGEVRGGFGLGLASARRMAELMGGAAGHEPAWRGGSAFWLELPRA